MAVWTEIFQNSSEIKSKNILEVKSQDSVEVTDSGTKSIEASSNTFVLSSGGMYTGNMSGNIPTWLDDAITTEIANGTAPISQSVDDLDTYVKNMETGINQDVVNLQNEDQSLNALITTNKTESDNSIAAISDTLVTKITADDATAISQQVMASEFSDPNSYITNSAWYLNNVKTYADATSSNTTSLDALSSVVTDPVTGVEATADIIKTGYTTIGLNNDGTLSATANQSEYISAAIGPQKVSIDASDNVTIDANGVYTATTSKLITGADGSISGWTNSNYNGRSDFTIQADTFQVQGTDSGYTPFAIDTATGKIKFTGDVKFEGLGIDGSSTDIDGGIIKTGTINSNKITSNTITAGNLDFITDQGRIDFSNSIGPTLLSDTPFMQNFFSYANQGTASTVLTNNASYGICVDDQIWYMIYRDGLTLNVRAIGTSPEGFPAGAGWNCGGSANTGLTATITYTQEQADASGSVSATIYHPFDGTRTITYSSFNDVPLYGTGGYHRLPTTYGGSGAFIQTGMKVAIYGGVPSNAPGIIDYGPIHGGMATQIGKEFPITFDVPPLKSYVMLPIGIYSVKPGTLINGISYQKFAIGSARRDTTADTVNTNPYAANIYTYSTSIDGVGDSFSVASSTQTVGVDVWGIDSNGAWHAITSSSVGTLIKVG